MSEITKRPIEEKPLTAKQKAFIPAYVACLNASQAAIQAGYSEKGSGQAGLVLLKDPRIRKAVDELLQKKMAEQGITAEWVLERIKAVGMSAEEDKDRTNALRAYEMLGKHLKLFEKQEQQGGVTVVITSALPSAPGQQVIEVNTEPVALPPVIE